MVTQQPLYLIDSSNILLNALHHGLDCHSVAVELLLFRAVENLKFFEGKKFISDVARMVSKFGDKH